MALPGALDFRTPEERARDHQTWIEKHSLVAGRRYTFEVNKIWISGWNWLGTKRMRWVAYIKETECPWGVVACKIDFRTRLGAEQWARDYLKRGGPPEGYFDPPPPDPNEVLYAR